jgi:large-conductance mechanosensitive channel
VRLVAQATNFHVVATNIFSMITEVFSYAKKEERKEKKIMSVHMY